MLGTKKLLVSAGLKLNEAEHLIPMLAVRRKIELLSDLIRGNNEDTGSKRFYEYGAEGNRII